MIAGLLMIPIGMTRILRRQRRTGEVSTLRWPVINLNEDRHRNAFIIFAAGTNDTALYLKDGAETEPQASRIFTMDCMDCHNRPSHSYRPPAFFVNEAITSSEIPASLPQIKSLAMDICSNEFSTSDSAMNHIRQSVTEFYAANYSDTSFIRPQMIEQAINGLQKVYAANIFPEMGVRWDRYPNHIGHMEFNGCFRCHNDSFRSKSGHVVSKDCKLCHLITAQGKTEALQAAAFGESLEFQHPVDIEDAWKDGLCTDCHTGLKP
jgi:hypothetical protein